MDLYSQLAWPIELSDEKFRDDRHPAAKVVVVVIIGLIVRWEGDGAENFAHPHGPMEFSRIVPEKTLSTDFESDTVAAEFAERVAATKQNFLI